MTDISGGDFGPGYKALQDALAQIRRTKTEIVAAEGEGEVAANRLVGLRKRLEQEVNVFHRINRSSIADQQEIQQAAERRTRATPRDTVATRAQTEENIRSANAWRQRAAAESSYRVSFSQAAQRYLPQGYGGGGGGGGGAPPAGPGGPGGPYRGPRGAVPGGAGAPEPRLSYITREGEARIAALNREESQLIGTFNSGSVAMQRNGALTSEFFQAAAKGTVTLRDLGYQVGVTIGKFGGWILAGSAVFAAVGAIGQLATGAMDAQTGVTDLQRVLNNVDAGRLQGQLSGLAEHFNVPIKDAADAVYQMGKVFKDQDQAVSAAATALYAVKIGELSVTDATRYLTSIIQGANLSAADMASLFDQVNNAQNTFGVSIQGTLAGMAKATGSFRNLGGDVQRYLLPLIAVSQKLTGQTGDVAGTAFQRIPNYLAQAKNQATLRQYGIKPEANIDVLLQKELELAQSGKLKRDELRNIAYATFGHFYGPRIGVPLLQNPQRVQQYIQQLSPGASRGSAEKELSTALGSIEEKIKKIGVELQRMGDKLIKTHLLDVFYLLIVSLGELLQYSNKLIDNFNKLPEGVRQALSYGVELLAILKLAQRFQLGETLFPGQKTGTRGTLGRLLGNPQTPSVGYRAGQKQIADESKHYEELRNSYARTAAISSGTVRYAEQENIQLEQRIAALDNTAAGTKEAALLQGQIARNNQIIAAETQNFGLAAKRSAAAEADRVTSVQQGKALKAQGLSAVTGKAGESAMPPILIAGKATEDDIKKAAEAQGHAARSLTPTPETEGALASAETDAALAASGSGRLRQSASRFFSTGGRGILGAIGEFGFIAFLAYQATQIFDDEISKWYGKVESAGQGPQSADHIKQRLSGLHDAAQHGLRDTLAGIAGKAGGVLSDVGGHLGPAGVPLRLAGAVGSNIDEHARLMQQAEELAEAQFRDEYFMQIVRKSLKPGSTIAVPDSPAQAEAQYLARQKANELSSKLPQLGSFFKSNFGFIFDSQDKAVNNFAENRARWIATQLSKVGGLGGPKARGALSQRLAQLYPQAYGTYLGEQDLRNISSLPAEGKAAAFKGLASKFEQDSSRLTPREYNRRKAELDVLLHTHLGIKPEDAKAIRAIIDQGIAAAVAMGKGKSFESRLHDIKDPKLLQDLLDAQQSLQSIGKNDGTIHRAEEIYQRILKVVGDSHTPEDLKKIAAAKQALAQVIQNQIDLFGANADVRASRINEATDPIGAARETLRDAQGKLAIARAHPGLDKQAMDGLIAEVNKARIALGETIREQAVTIRDGAFDIQSARDADNPIKQARDAIAKAQYDLSVARTPEDRQQATIALIDARHQLRDQIFQRQFDDIQYQHDIGKLTLEQEIQQYRQMLKNATLTRDQRHQLKEQIVQLKQQVESDAGGFELDVGNIKLPTVYEIKRAIGGGYGAQTSVTTNANVTVNVANSEDVPKVGQAIDRSLGGGTAAALRNAGML